MAILASETTRPMPPHHITPSRGGVSDNGRVTSNPELRDAPQTAYASAADGTNIAYQVVGDGPVDLVFVPGWISNVDLFWEMAATRRFFSRLASFARLIRSATRRPSRCAPTTCAR
jgi:hypothetical protein